MKSKIMLFLIILLLTMAVHSQNQNDAPAHVDWPFSITEKEGYNLVSQVDGPTLGYSPQQRRENHRC